MARIDDETVTAYAGVSLLTALYDAYRASSRAHLLVLRRMSGAVAADERRAQADGLETQARLVRRAGLARQADAVFAVRARQLRERLLELRALDA
jgi:hypothetical protein